MKENYWKDLISFKKNSNVKVKYLKNCLSFNYFTKTKLVYYYLYTKLRHYKDFRYYISDFKFIALNYTKINYSIQKNLSIFSENYVKQKQMLLPIFVVPNIFLKKTTLLQLSTYCLIVYKILIILLLTKIE